MSVTIIRRDPGECSPSIFRKPEDRAIELLIGRKASLLETQRILQGEGVKFSLDDLRSIRRRAFESLVQDYREEVMSDFLLDSIQKVTIKFEDIYGKFEKLYERFEREDRPYEQMVVLRDLKGMLSMSLRKLGEYKGGIESIKAQNVQIINNNDVVQAIKDNQHSWFRDMEPEVRNGELVFHKPKPEVLDAFYRFSFSSRKGPVSGTRMSGIKRAYNVEEMETKSEIFRAIDTCKAKD